MIAYCAECGEKFEYNSMTDTARNEDTGEIICEKCTQIYNDLAERMLEKAFKEMPPLYRNALAVERFPGLGDFLDVVREERE